MTRMEHFYGMIPFSQKWIFTNITGCIMGSLFVLELDGKFEQQRSLLAFWTQISVYLHSGVFFVSETHMNKFMMFSFNILLELKIYPTIRGNNFFRIYKTKKYWMTGNTLGLLVTPGNSSSQWQRKVIRTVSVKKTSQKVQYILAWVSSTSYPIRQWFHEYFNWIKTDQRHEWISVQQ